MGRRHRRKCDCGRRIPEDRRWFCSYTCSVTADRGKPYRQGILLITEMWSEQSGRCLLCGEPFQGAPRQTVVDHDHRTGAIRGLLHQKCNLRLGHFENFQGTVAQRDAQYGEFAIRAVAYVAAAARREIREISGDYAGAPLAA